LDDKEPWGIDGSESALACAKKSQTHRRRTKAPVMARTPAQTEARPRLGTKRLSAARRMLNGM